MTKFKGLPAKFEKAGNKEGSMLVRLTQPISFNSFFGEMIVPSGFVSDGASIPRIFWSIFCPFDGEFFEAALIHDFLYSLMAKDEYDYIDRNQADQIFLEGMKDLGVGLIKRNIIYRAVRIGGGANWRTLK